LRRVDMNPIITRGSKSTYVVNQEIIINEVIGRRKSDMINYVIDNWNKTEEKKFEMIKNINNIAGGSLLSLYLRPGYYPDREVLNRIVELLDKEKGNMGEEE